MRVKIRGTYCQGVQVPDTTVDLEPEGERWDGAPIWVVTWEGRRIGTVWKTTRTSSPPLYPGSRIVKYHKSIPCWEAQPPGYHVPTYQRDQRNWCLEHLLAYTIRHQQEATR